MRRNQTWNTREAPARRNLTLLFLPLLLERDEMFRRWVSMYILVVANKWLVVLWKLCYFASCGSGKDKKRLWKKWTGKLSSAEHWFDSCDKTSKMSISKPLTSRNLIHFQCSNKSNLWIESGSISKLDLRNSRGIDDKMWFERIEIRLMTQTLRVPVFESNVKI